MAFLFFNLFHLSLLFHLLLGMPLIDEENILYVIGKNILIN